MILMLVRILLSISSSSASTRLSSNAGALPSRASTSSSIEFIPPPAEPARSSHPARWPRIRRTLFKSCPTNVRRVDKRRCHASFCDQPDSTDAAAFRTEDADFAGAATMTTQSTTWRIWRARPSELTREKGFELPSSRIGTSVFAIRGSLRSNSGRGTSMITWPGVRPARRAIRSSARRRSFGSWKVASTDRVAAVSSSRSDAKTRLYSLRYLRQGDLPLERPLTNEPVQQLVIYHLLDLGHRSLRTFDGPGEHLLRDADGFVEVHGRIHQAAGDEHPLQRREAFPIERELSAVCSKGLEQPREVDHPVGRPGVVRVPHQVVDLVRIHGTVDDLGQVPRRLLPTAGDDPRGPLLRRPADEGCG